MQLNVNNLTERDHKETIQTFIRNAKTIDDLLPIFKSVLSSALNDLNAPNSKSLYFTVASIERILDDDVLQHILSFLYPSHTVRCVCKLFRNLAYKNLANLKKQRLEAVDAQFFDIDPTKFDPSSNATYIVDNSRQTISLEETQLGYYGPCDLKHAMANCKSGDKILVFDGHYQLKCEDAAADFFASPIDIDKSVQIIGVGQKVVFENDANHRTVFNIGEISSCHIYFENIKFDRSWSEDTTEGFILVNAGSRVWLNNCSFKFALIGIDIRAGADAFLKNCQFEGGTTAVEVSMLSGQVLLIGCTFTKCGSSNLDNNVGFGPCVGITNTGGFEVFEDSEFVKLTCVGNVFMDNDGYTVAIQSELDHTNVCAEQCVFQSNVLCGENGRKLTKNNNVYSANKIYLNEETNWI